MTPTETLMHEHQIILMVLQGAEREAQKAQSTGKLDIDQTWKMLDFFRTFADKCHHAKEERILFVRLAERGMPVDSGPIAMMNHEHTLGRACLKAVADSLPEAEEGDPEAIAIIAKSLQDYVALLREHISKEDNILYPMANKLLTQQDQEWLDREFEKVEKEEIGEGVHEKYHEMAHELAEV